MAHLVGYLLLPVLSSLLPLTLAQNGSEYCDKARFWSENFTSSKGAQDWASWGQDSGFEKGPCARLSGIQMTVTWQSTIIITDGMRTSNGWAKLPNNQTAIGLEIALDGANWPQRPLDVVTDPFCSGGLHLPNGTLLSIGGYWMFNSSVPNGIKSVRAFSPCTNQNCSFSIAGDLQMPRWYPTSTLLPDGRAFIVGGSSKMVGYTSLKNNVPYIEYFPAGGVKPVYVQLLNDTIPYNLYPFVHVMPSGRVFIFAASRWILFDTKRNGVVTGKRPELNATGANGRPIFRSYPLTGTSALLPVGANRTAEVLICGGTTSDAFDVQFTGGYSTAGGNPNATADNMCYVIAPEVSDLQWRGYRMQVPRVMANAVLLPDGHVLIINGAMTGWAGIGVVGHKAVLTPAMFHSSTKQFYQGPLPASKIPRVYHSSAVLLGNGSVFLSGSNPNWKRAVTGQDFPTEYRTEFFFPPYAKTGVARPSVLSAPKRAQIGKQIIVRASYIADTINSTSVVLCHPGFSTHSNNHGMRNVILPVLNVTVSNIRGGQQNVSITTLGCPNKNLCPPTWYWLFVLLNGIPSLKTTVIFMK